VRIESGSFGHRSGTKAAGTDSDMNGPASLQSLHLVEIGEPNPTGLVVRMTDMVTVYRPFATDFAYPCHGSTSNSFCRRARARPLPPAPLPASHKGLPYEMLKVKGWRLEARSFRRARARPLPPAPLPASHKGLPYKRRRRIHSQTMGEWGEVPLRRRVDRWTTIVWTSFFRRTKSIPW
jgi:hypothetical protein